MHRSSSAPDLRLLVELPPQLPPALTGAVTSPWQPSPGSSYSGALVPYKGIEVRVVYGHADVFMLEICWASDDVPAIAG